MFFLFCFGVFRGEGGAEGVGGGKSEYFSLLSFHKPFQFPWSSNTFNKSFRVKGFCKVNVVPCIYPTILKQRSTGVPTPGYVSHQMATCARTFGRTECIVSFFFPPCLRNDKRPTIS